MSSRKKGLKSVDKGREEARPVPRPSVRPPTPSVLSRHEGVMVSRSSKGFSYGEVEGSGMSLLAARRWGVPVDLKRRSVLDGNVQALKGWYVKSAKGGAGEVKKVEAELGKLEREVGQEVRKGVSKAKGEVVKAGREAKKLEKEVVEKVEEPVKKRRAKAKSTQKKGDDEES